MKPTPFLRRFLAIAGSAVLTISYSQAAPVNWDGDTSVTWATTGNWYTLPTNDLTTDIANFDLATYGGGVFAPNAGTTSINGLTVGASNGAMTLTTNLSIGNSGITIANGAGAASVAGTVTLGAGQSWLNNSANLFSVGGGAVTNGGNPLTIGGSGNTTVSSDITGTGGLTKSGAGTLTLSGANSYSGTTTLSGGTLALANYYSATALDISANSTISVARNFAATWNGALTGSGTLTLTGGFASATSSQLSLVNNSGNTFSGNMIIDGTTLRVGGNIYATGTAQQGFTAPSMGSGSTITIRPGGTLNIDDNVTNSVAGYVSNRFGSVGNRPAVSLTGGTLNLNGANNNAVMTQSLGALTATSGYSTVSVTRANGTPTLAFDSLAINSGSVLNFYSATLGTGSADARITFATAPTMINGIIAGAKVWSGGAGAGEFATYGANGVAAFTAYDVVSNDINTGTSATTNFAMTAATTPVTLTADRAVNSLNYRANGGTWSLGGNKLTLTSGMFLRNGTNSALTINNGTLTAGNGTDDIDLHIFTAQQNLTIDAVIADNAASAVTLVKSHGNQLTVSGGANNTYSGGTYVVDGLLATGNVASRRYLGTGKVTVDRTGSLTLAAVGATSFSTANQAAYTVLNGGTITIKNLAYTTASDTFDIRANSILFGDTTTTAGNGLNSITRVASLTGITGGQAVFERGSILAFGGTLTTGLGTGVQTLAGFNGGTGTAADLYFGLGANTVAASTITVGAGTPWLGISTDGSARNYLSGTITANGDFNLQGLGRPGVAPAVLTMGSTGAMAVNTPNGDVNANIIGAVTWTTASTALGSANNDLTFQVNPGATFTLTPANALGASAGSTVGVVVQNGGTLAIGAANSLNAATTIQGGGKFNANLAGGLTGSGALTFQGGSIIDVSNVTGFSGAQATAATVNAGTIVRLNVAAYGAVGTTLDSFLNTDSPIYEIFGGDRAAANPTAAGTTIMTLNKDANGVGGILTNDSATRIATATTNGLITIGANGGVIAATTGTTLTVAEDITFGGNLTLGTTQSIDGLPKLGAVTLSGGFALGGANRTISVGSGLGTVTLSGALSSTSASNKLTLDGAGPVTIGSITTGTNNPAIEVGGTGTYTFNGTSTFTGGVLLSNSAATVLATTNAGLGATSGKVKFNVAGTTLNLRGATLSVTSGIDSSAFGGTIISEPATAIAGVTQTMTLANTLGTNTIIMSPGQTLVDTAYGLTLSGANAFSGANTNATFTINGNGNATSTLTLSGGFNTNASSQTLTFNTGSGTGTRTATISGAFTGTAGTLVLAGSAPVTIGALTGTANALQINSTTGGVYTSNGASTFTGGVTLTSGTLVVNNAGVAAASGALGNGGTFVINGGTVDTVSAGITNANVNPITIGADFAFGGTGNLNLGTGAVTNAGTSRTITLNGTSKTLTMGGTMTNTAGAIQTTTVNGAGNTFSIGGYALSNSVSNYINVINGTGNVTISGTVSNGGTSSASGLTYSGSGALTLGGANTFAGGVNLNSGTLNINSTTALGAAAGTFAISGGTTINNTSAGAVVVANTNPITVGGNFTFGGTQALTLPGTVDLGGGVRTITTNGTTNGLTLSGVVSNGTGLTKDGTGTLVLSVGASSNSYTGTTTLTAGTLQGATSQFAATPTNPFGSTALQLNGGTLQLRSSGVTGGPAGNNTAETVTFGNNTTVGGDTAIDIRQISTGPSAANKTLRLGTLSIGANTLTVGGANTYGLRFGATTASGAANFTNNTGAVTLTLDSLTLDNSITTGTTTTITVGGTGSTNITGAITNNGVDPTKVLALSKTGSATLTLSGSSNTYTGGITIAAGTVTPTVAGSIASGTNVTFTGNEAATSTLNIANAASVGFTGGAITVNAGAYGNISPSTGNSQTWASATSGSNTSVLAVEKGSGGSTMTINDVSAFTGVLRVGPGSSSNPTFKLGKLTDGAGYGNLQFGGSTSNTPTFEIFNNTGSLTFASGGRAIEILSTSTASIPTLSNNQALANTWEINTNLINSRSGATTLTLTGSNAGNNTFGGVIGNGAGTISINKTGNGTWSLSNASNSYTGGTNLGGGILEFASGALGSSGNITFTGSSTLRWATGNTQDISSRLVMGNGFTSTINTNGNDVSFASGFGSSTTGLLVKAGAGTLTLAGANTFSGTTTVTAGTLALTNNLALQNSALVTTSGTSTYAGGAALTLGGLSGATGDLGSANVLNGYTGIVTALTLNPQTGVSVSYGGVISNGSGAMTLTKTGAGIQTLTGTNTYTGGTFVSAGTLAWTANASLGAAGSRNITVTGNSTLTGFNGFSLNTLSVNSLATATFTAGVGGTFASTTGSGNITFNGQNNNTSVLDLSNASAFTGNLQNNIGGTGNTPTKAIQFTSLGDGGALRFGGTDGNGSQSSRFRLYGDAGPLTMTTRAVEFLNPGAGNAFDRAILQNDNANPANRWLISPALINATNRAHALELGGTNTGNNEFAGAIANSTTAGNVLRVNKVGTGTWSLSGANSYTGTTAVSAGTLIARSASALGTSTTADVSVATNTGLIYNAQADAALAIGGTLAITGGTSTVIGTSVGSTATSAQINATEAATISSAAHSINIYGVNGVTHATGLVTLIHGGAGSSLNPAIAPTLGTVYNNTDFTVGAFTRSATDLQVTLNAATALSGGVYWKGGLAGNTVVWSASNGTTTSNWQVTDGVNQALAPGATADLIFSAATSPGTMVGMSLGADMTIKTLTVSNTATAFDLLNDGYKLTITPGAATDGITLNAGLAASPTIAANIGLGASQTWTNNSGKTLTVSGIVSGANNLTKAGADTIALTGANTYTGNTTVSAGTLKLDRVAANNTTILTDGNTATISDIVINGGTLELSQSEQIANTGSINMSSGAFNFGAATGKTETIDKFTNSGGTFSTGANTLIGLGNTVTWSGGTNTVNNGGSVQDAHIVISGGTNTVEGGATGGVLQLNASGLGLEMSNGATLTLNSDNLVAGRLLLKGDVSSSGNATVTIASGLALTNNGRVDLDGGTRTFTIANGTAATDMTIGAVITNGALTKAGAGTLELTGANTYTGATTVTNGALAVNGSLANTTTTVGTGTPNTGTLQGSGSIGGSVTIQNGGTLAAGNSNIDSLATGALSLENLAVFAYEMNKSAAPSASGDLTAVTGNLTILSGAVLTLTELGVTGSWTAGDKLTLISYSGTLVNNLFTYGLGTITDGATITFSGVDWTFDYDDTLAGDNYTGELTGPSFVTMTVVVPEPGAALIGSLGLLALLRRRRS